MSERLITILLQGAIALLMCITLNAQGPPPAALERAVLEKTRVSVVQADSGDEAEGRLISVTPTTLSLLVKNQRFDVPLQTLSRVDAI
jgi:hypothetical protein